MSFPNANVASPVLSPSDNEYGEALYTDEHGNVLELFVAAPLDANGIAGLPTGAGVIAGGHVSQVTARKQSAVCMTPGGEKIRVQALVSVDGSGNPIPFAAPSAKVVSGKFQSTVQTGSGSAQSIAHGLGVVPSLVLVSVYNNDALSSWSVVEGAHTSTNVIVTATSGISYKVIAFA
jgi:hypothetical protein